MALDQFGHLAFIHNFTAGTTLVNLRQGVVEPLAKSHGAAQRRVESAQHLQLELVRAFQEVLQVRERQLNIGYVASGLGIPPGTTRIVRH